MDIEDIRNQRKFIVQTNVVLNVITVKENLNKENLKSAITVMIGITNLNYFALKRVVKNIPNASDTLIKENE